MGHLKDTRGFTLIELMLSILLLSILFLAAWGLLGQSFIFWKQGEHRADMYDSLRISFDRMGRELRYAKGITTSSNSDSLYFLSAEGITVWYYCSSYTLYRKEQGEVSQPLASDIQSVSYTYINSSGSVVSDVSTQASTVRQVKITITAKKQGSKVAPVVLTQKVSLRALQ